MKIDASLMFEPVKVGEMAADIEKAGFDGAYTFEGKSDPFISLTAAALRTQKLELMTSIAVAFARNPMSLAYIGNDLQNLSQGRFILGLGTQVKAHIERRFSMPWGKPVTRMRDMVLALRAIWDSWQTGERLKYEGEYYQHTLSSPVFSPEPNQYGTPDIYIAGVGPVMTELAGEVGDGYFVHPFNTVQSMEKLSLAAISRGLEKAGKSRDGFNVSVQVITGTGLTDQDMEQSIASARNQIGFYASTPAYLPVLECHGWEGLQQEAISLVRDNKWAELNNLIDDDILKTFAVIGTPSEVAAQIAERYQGVADRISPVVYQPDLELLSALRTEINAAVTCT
ncbi:MAG: TIGR03617 family F420-dependent LLM class oxidoreductase [Halioglobus sp.]